MTETSRGEPREATPVFAWLVLAAAVLAVSSAGAVLKTIAEVPPFLRASWRLQATSLVLLPFAVQQWRALGPSERSRFFGSDNLALMLGSSVCLAGHFAAWVWSLDHTSLPHSLLFVTAHPLVIVAALALLGRPLSGRQTTGAVLGFFGAAVAMFGYDAGGEVSALGDLAAFSAAVAVVGYLAAGHRARRWMPLFVYAFPITLAGAVMLTLFAVVAEGAVWGSGETSVQSARSVFGWVDGRWFPTVAYLALGPGLVGHTGINAVLRWLPPIVISVAVLLEPVIGTAIGLLLGTTGPPDLWTYAAGSLILLGLFLLVSDDANARVETSGAIG